MCSPEGGEAPGRAPVLQTKEPDSRSNLGSRTRTLSSTSHAQVAQAKRANTVQPKSVRKDSAKQPVPKAPTLPEAEAPVEVVEALDTSSDDKEGVVVEKAKTLRRRAFSNRYAAFVSAMVAGATMAGSYLEHLAVSEGVAKDYANRLELLMEYVNAHALPFVTDTQVEQAIVEFLNQQYLRGRPAADGEKLVAAVVFSQPKYSRSGGQALARVWKCIRGWRIVAPPRSRDPEMLEVWCGIMYVLTAMEESAMALMIAVGLSCYFRPGEALGIQIQDVLRPHRSCAGLMSIIILPRERTAVSKTGETDNNCLLDCNWMTWLPCAILLHIERLGLAHGNLFDFSYPQFYCAFMTACQRLGVRSVVPYQWRHSGASIDRSRKTRTLDEVRKRGFWKSHKMRYEKAGRLHVSFRKYSLDQRLLFEAATQEIENVMTGKVEASLEKVPFLQP